MPGRVSKSYWGRFGRLTETVGCVLLLGRNLGLAVSPSRPKLPTFSISRQSFHSRYRLDPQPEIGALHPHEHYDKRPDLWWYWSTALLL